jgi:acid phosphatase type 7
VSRPDRFRPSRRFGATILAGLLALGIGAWLGFAGSAAAKSKHPARRSHQQLRCRAGYVRHTVLVPVRVHGRIVRRHHKILYTRVQRCARATKRNPSLPPKRPPIKTPPVVPPPPPPLSTVPVNTVVPTISGPATQGSTLGTSPGTWTNEPTSYSYQWQQCTGGGGSCQNVAGQTSSTYPVSSADVGSTIRVSVGASNGSGSASATSAPAGPVGAPTDPVVVAVGDIARPPSSCTTPSSCPQYATESIAQSFHPTSVFVLGDNQYDSGLLSEYTGSYALSWGVFNPIVHPVPGNHEYLTSGAAGYFDYFGQAAAPSGGYYSFTLGTWHIVALNSNCSDQNGCSDSLAGGTTSAQTSWLQSDLAANQSPCLLAMWHHPLFSSGWTLGTPSVLPLWTALYNAHADVVLNGHDHLYERYAQQDPSGNATTNGIREFVVGTGGESLNGLSAHPSTLEASDASDYGVLVLTLHASSYSWKFVTTSGTSTDSGTATCHGAGAGAAPAAVAAAHLARSAEALRLNGPRLSFDALPVRASLRSVMRTGLAVAVHSSRGVDVAVTTWLRRGHQLRRIATAYETESQIPKPYSQIVLHLPSRRLRGRTSATLVVRFAAVDSAGQRRTVTRTMSLR